MGSESTPAEDGAEPDATAVSEVAEPAFEANATDRLIFFSDAVVAIAITLLALDLPVPQGDTNSDVLRAARGYLDSYLAFLVSFGVIALRWYGHHQVFRYVRGVDAIRSQNMLWLLTIVVTPFATRLLTGPGAFQVPFVFYSLVQVVGGLAFLAMMRRIDARRLLRPGAPPGLMRTAFVRLTATTAMFVISIPVAYFGQVAYLCWILIPAATKAFELAANRWWPERAA